MATPTTRQGLIDYCLRRLGDPVVEINVDYDQLEDKVDDALQTYQEFHTDATYRTFVSVPINSTDITNKYITLDPDILFVTKVFPIQSAFNSGRNFFDIKYQMMLNDMADMNSYIGDLAYYEQTQQYLSLLDMKLNGMVQSTWVRKQNRLYIHGDFVDGDVVPGDYIVLEVYKTVNPSTHTAIWNDMFMKDYTTALIKQQWGTNMMKFEGMQLPGGVIFNGRQYYDDATGDLEALRERLRLEYEMPIDFMVG